ncbi:MAG TPA: hypothetical protein VHF26_15255, partial [Trebonia sp.]|nr:hypothetical protein [Trebonia sp.]
NTVSSGNTVSSRNTVPRGGLAARSRAVRPLAPVHRAAPADPVARAAVDAVVNRWGNGPDTPAGVRARLRRTGAEAAELAGRLTDEEIRVAGAGVRRLYREWAALPVGGTLRATWPLHDSWLRLL